MEQSTCCAGCLLLGSSSPFFPFILSWEVVFVMHCLGLFFCVCVGTCGFLFHGTCGWPPACYQNYLNQFYLQLPPPEVSVCKVDLKYYLHLLNRKHKNFHYKFLGLCPSVLLSWPSGCNGAACSVFSQKAVLSHFSHIPHELAPWAPLCSLPMHLHWLCSPPHHIWVSHSAFLQQPSANHDGCQVLQAG